MQLIRRSWPPHTALVHCSPMDKMFPEDSQSQIARQWDNNIRMDTFDNQKGIQHQ